MAFFKRPKLELKDAPLDQVSFSAQDLFCLLGGFDLGAFACNLNTIDFDEVETFQSHEGAWKRAMIQRLGPTGFVSPTGEPSDELARALAPLRGPGISIGDGILPTDEYDQRSASLSVGETGATAIVSEKTGFFGQGRIYRLVPFGDDRSSWDSTFARVFHDDRPVGDAGVECCGMAKGDAADRLIQAIDKVDEPVLRTWSAGAGIDADLFVNMVRRTLGSNDLPMFVYNVRDFTGDAPRGEWGWNLPSAARVTYSFIQAGFSFSDCFARRPQDGADWFMDDEAIAASKFVRVDLTCSTSMLDSLLMHYPYPSTTEESGHHEQA